MRHVALDHREKLQKLSCHRLPGVDIRPGEAIVTIIIRIISSNSIIIIVIIYFISFVII